MKFSVLTSGSKGNCTVLCHQQQKIIFDAGLSFKRMQELANSVELDLDGVMGIIISHEHSDHVKGAGVLARKFNVPLYITKPTFSACCSKLGQIPQVHFFEAGHPFPIGDFIIEPFTISHDAIDPVAFATHCADKKVVLATDIGKATLLLETKMQDADALILEANHDVKMLQEGPYPWQLKQRIMSNRGHLSNESSAQLFEKVVSNRLRTLILAHLSEQNNTPEFAEQAFVDMMRKLENVELMVASNQWALPIITV